MKNSLRRALLLLLPLFFLSCGDEETGSEGFRLGVSRDVTIIPVDGMDNCTGSSLSKSYFRINLLNIEWDRTDEDLTLSFLRVEIRNSLLDSDYIEIMDADSLAQYLVYENDSGGVSNISSGVVPAPLEGQTRMVVNRSNCTVPFDGLGVDEDSRNFTITGRIEVRGVAVGNVPGDEGNLGQERPVRARANFRLIYDFN